MKVKPILQVNGNPLRRAYVEHLIGGLGKPEMYITDDEGRVRDIHGDEGIDNLIDGVDIRIICQNPVVRVLDGTRLNTGVFQDRFVRDGDVVNLDTQQEQDDWYAILNRTQLAYEVIFQPLTFFQDLDHPEFPLGRKATLRETRDQARRIELSYPDKGVQPLAFVEPARFRDHFPLVHIKDRMEDGRLFGEQGTNDSAVRRPTLIPHELTHAIHFALLSRSQRTRVFAEYVDFFLGEIATGGNLRHELDKRTTAEVAFIEAGGHFGQAFWEFLRARLGRRRNQLVRPEMYRRDAALLDDFLESEFAQHTTGPTIRPDLRNIARPPLTTVRPVRPRAIDRHTNRTPNFTGGDREGAVYGAIFTDFAQDVGLDAAASAYFASNALTFGEYRDFIRRTRSQADADALERAKDFWGL